MLLELNQTTRERNDENPSICKLGMRMMQTDLLCPDIFKDLFLNILPEPIETISFTTSV